MTLSQFCLIPHYMIRWMSTSQFRVPPPECPFTNLHVIYAHLAYNSYFFEPISTVFSQLSRRPSIFQIPNPKFNLALIRHSCCRDLKLCERFFWENNHCANQCPVIDVNLDHAAIDDDLEPFC